VKPWLEIDMQMALHTPSGMWVAFPGRTSSLPARGARFCQSHARVQRGSAGGASGRHLPLTSSRAAPAGCPAAVGSCACPAGCCGMTQYDQEK